MSEFAPVVVLTPSGHRLATDAERQRLRGDWLLVLKSSRRLIRRLSYSDPDDRRMIWRLAALHFGYNEEAASTAILSRRPMPDYEDVVDWILVVRVGIDEECIWSPSGDMDQPDDVESATAALCAAVWGPK